MTWIVTPLILWCIGYLYTMGQTKAYVEQIGPTYFYKSEKAAWVFICFFVWPHTLGYWNGIEP
jgi:hypothetical protein